MEYLTNRTNEYVNIKMTLLTRNPTKFISIIFVVYSVLAIKQDINLEDYEIFETIDSKNDDFKDFYNLDAEMIKSTTSEPSESRAKLNPFFRLHQMVRRRNANVKTPDFLTVNKKKPYKEYNLDVEDPLPYKVGFIDKAEPKPNDIKRDSPNEEDESDYNFNELQKEYNEEIKQEKRDPEVYNSTEVKEEETIIDALGTLINFKPPANCSEEEKKGIGTGALECVLMDKSAIGLTGKAAKITKAIFCWIAICALVMLGCWCEKGWCCCCCRCRCCFPKQRIDEVKKFVAQNPVGVYHDDDGKEIKYEPSAYEKYAQKKLEADLKRL